MINNKFKTGIEWTKLFDIQIIKPLGWNDEDHFLNTKISRDEFCNRAVNSELVKKTAISRREALKCIQNGKTIN